MYTQLSIYLADPSIGGVVANGTTISGDRNLEHFVIKFPENLFAADLFGHIKTFLVENGYQEVALQKDHDSDSSGAETVTEERTDDHSIKWIKVICSKNGSDYQVTVSAVSPTEEGGQSEFKICFGEYRKILA